MLIKGIVRLTFIVFGRGILLQCYIWTFAVYFKTYCEFQRNTKCMHALLIPQEKGSACAYFMKLFLH